MKQFQGSQRQKNLAPKDVSRKNLTCISEDENGIAFSFRYFRQIDNFGITGKNDTWMSGLLEQLRLLSEKNADELLSDVKLKDCLRMHPLDLTIAKSALTEKDFELIPEKYRPTALDCPVMQFQISKANGRVIGYFNENHSVFYVLFLDPNHNAQLSQYNDCKIREIKPCMSEIDDMKARIAKHVCLNRNLSNEAEEFLYVGSYTYLCIDSEFVNPLIKQLKEGEFQSKLEEFLLSRL